MDTVIRVAKTKALISFAVTAKLICVFVFAYADCWVSHEAAHILRELGSKQTLYKVLGSRKLGKRHFYFSDKCHLYFNEQGTLNLKVMLSTTFCFFFFFFFFFFRFQDVYIQTWKKMTRAAL